MPAQREALAELRQFIDFADAAYLREHLRLLAGPLGIDEQQLHELRALEPEELAHALRALVQEQRMHIRAARARQAEEHANRAAAELGRTAEWIPNCTVGHQCCLGGCSGPAVPMPSDCCTCLEGEVSSAYCGGVCGG
jgi:hypothetical protein